jgi:hypothetical protein
MAVRSKMSTARSRGRAVVKTTTPKNGTPKTLPEVSIKPKSTEPTYAKGSKLKYETNSSLLNAPSSSFTVGEDTRSMKERTTKDRKADKYYDMRHPDADMRVADISDEDQELIRKQLNAKGDQDIELSQSMYDAWKKSGKRTSPEKFRSDFKSQAEFDAYNPYSKAANDWGFSGSLHGTIISRDPEKNKIPARKELVKTGSKFAAKAKQKAIDERKLKQKDIDIKGKAAEEDIMVPETVSGPKGRTKTKSKLAFGYKPTLARKLNMPMKQERVGDWKKTDLVERITGLQKPTTNYSRRGVTTETTREKVKNARLSERMKFKKEEKLAGGRERVLGMSGVALKDQANKYGKAIKRGEKLQEGSAQRLKDIKALYGGEKEEVTGALSGVSSGKTRVEALKGAKSDIKEIGKLSKSYVKERKAASGEKGKAMVKAKAMKEQYKSEKKPIKFSKDDTAEDTKKKLEAIQSRKTPAQFKEMKTAYKSATKEARGMKRTAEERAQTRSAVKATRGTAKEARSYKGDVRKGLRMEKGDTRAINVAAKTSDAKKSRKTEKGKTMRGTSYFSMSELNKTIPLKGAANVAKYKEPKLMTMSDIKKYAKSGKDVKVGKILEAGKNIKTGARQYSSSQGKEQAGARRFSKK